MRPEPTQTERLDLLLERPGLLTPGQLARLRRERAVLTGRALRRAQRCPHREQNDPR